MAWSVVFLLLSWLIEIDTKATGIVGYTALAQYSNVPTVFWMHVFSSFGIRGDESSSHAICCIVPYLGRSHICGECCGRCYGLC